jgi:hypothetical protein
MRSGIAPAPTEPTVTGRCERQCDTVDCLPFLLRATAFAHLLTYARATTLMPGA